MESIDRSKQPDSLEWTVLRSLVGYLSLSIPVLYQQPEHFSYESIISTNLEDSVDFELTVVFLHLRHMSYLGFPTVNDVRCHRKLSSLCTLLDRLANLDAVPVVDQKTEDQPTGYQRLRKLLTYFENANVQWNLIRGKFGPAFQLPSASSIANDLGILVDVNQFFDSMVPLPRKEKLNSGDKTKHALGDTSELAIRQYAIAAFETIFQYLNTCKTTHKVMFGLPVPPDSVEASEKTLLDIFISACPAHASWQEAQFGQKKSPSRIIKDGDLCTIIQECQNNEEGLRLHVTGSKLQNLSDKLRQRRLYGNGYPSQSLYMLLTGEFLQRESVNHMTPGRWSRKQRKLLVSKMAQALKYLYDSNWMSKEWTSKNIFFGPEKPDKSQLPLGPFVSCSADGAMLCNEDIWCQQLPDCPSLILFGMMMMEIDLGRSLEIEVNKQIQNGRKLWPVLFDIWEEQMYDLEYPELIQACLNFHKAYKLAQQEKGADKKSMESWTRDYIFEAIVPKLDSPTSSQSTAAEEHLDLSSTPKFLLSLAPPPPLKSDPRVELDSTRNDVSPARQHSTGSNQTRETTTAAPQSSATSITEDESQQQSQIMESIGVICATSRTKPSIRAVVMELPKPAPSNVNFDVSQWLSTTEREATSDDAHLDNGELSEVFFDGLEVEDIRNKEQLEAKWACEFFEKTQKFNKMHIPRDPVREEERIKIAVIDTGVDLNDSVVKKYRKRITGQSWVGDDPENYTDICGHGTHIVRVLLKMNDSASIIAAKISQRKEDTFDRQRITNVAEAIRWAVGEGAHIISISLGFPTEQPEIARALEEAMSSAPGNTQRRIVFAASGNLGFTRARPYPANQQGVICIHALCGNGSDSNTNPEPGPGDRFGTLGVTIESRWNKKQMWISGSSFATPVAAATAANVLQFARQKMNLGPGDYGWQHLCSSLGMRTVLKLMCARANDYSFLMPWQLHLPEFLDGRKEFPTHEELCKAFTKAIDYG